MSAQHDLIIVGGGIAGLTAAVRAIELGIQPLVLEKESQDVYPCNSRQSGGVIHIGFLDPYRQDRSLMDNIETRTGGDHDPVLADALIKNGWRFLDWLKAQNTDFISFNEQEGYRWCIAPPRALRAGVDWEGRGPDLLLRRLVSKLSNYGDIFHQGVKATSLIMENGTCIGIRAIAGTREIIFKAKNVLLADGGFQFNRKLFEEFIGGKFDHTFQRGAGTGTGDGIKMAHAAGAKLSGMDKFYGHLLSADAVNSDKLWPYPELDAVATAGIVIDSFGTRVADEGKNGVYLTNALAKSNSEPPFFIICDASIWESAGRSARIPANPLLEEAGGTVFKSDTLEELAEAIGVPVEDFLNCVTKYNEAIDANKTSELLIPRSQKMLPYKINTAPFIAIPTIPGITYTMGGIVTDEKAQVLNENNMVIPGLLAAGATTGGLEGGGQAAYIGGLMKSGVFGMIAAEEVATKIDKLDVSKKAIPIEPKHDREQFSYSQKRGLVQFPVLRFLVSYGKTFSLISAFLALILAIWLGEPLLGLKAIPLGIFLFFVVGVIGIVFTELLRMIVKLLLPD